MRFFISKVAIFQIKSRIFCNPGALIFFIYLPNTWGQNKKASDFR